MKKGLAGELVLVCVLVFSGLYLHNKMKLIKLTIQNWKKLTPIMLWYFQMAPV